MGAKKKGAKAKKKIIVKEEPVKVVVVEEPKVKEIPPPKWDPIESENLFQQMKDDFQEYLNEKIENDENSNLNPSEKTIFRNNLFANFDSVLKQLETIIDDETRNEHINKVYNWYQEKLIEFETLTNIRVITKRPVFDFSPDISKELKNRKPVWEAENYPIEFEIKYRTKDEGSYIPPKEK